MRSLLGRGRLNFVRVSLLFLAGLGLNVISSNAFAQNLDAKLFDPVTSPHGIIGVHTSRSMRHLSLVGRLSTNYANDVLLGRQGSKVVIRPIAQRVTTEFGVALGLFGWMEMALALPIYLYQSNEGYTPGSPGTFSSGSQAATLLGDLRLVLKGRILENEKFGGFGLAVVLEASFPTGSRDQLAGDESLTFTPRIVADYRHKNGLAVAFNLAYRVRGQEKFFDLSIDDELRFSLGTEIPLFFSRLSLIGEALLVVGLPQSSGNDVSQTNVSTELRTGVRWRHDSGLILTLGAGFGVSRGSGAPDFRAFLDIAFGRNVQTGQMNEPLPPDYPTKYLVSKQPSVGAKPPMRRSVKVARSGGIPPKKRAALLPPSKRKVASVPPPKKAVALKKGAFDQAVLADPDPDGDGIPSSIDTCPNKAEDFDQFEDSDGCPELDNDKDGIPDRVDQCPLKPEVINGIKDDDGCPDKGQSKVLLTKGQIKISEKVFFNSGSDELQKRSFAILRQLASFLKAHWQVQSVLIEGHTDSRGDKEMNVDLAERRARRVMAFLVAQGVKVKILRAKGYGPKKPIANNQTSKGRAKNRRVAFKVLKVFIPQKSAAQKGSGK